ncbi:MAG: tyrosine-type recombinase/integrase [Candidatus Methanospirareceae archaeon]
MKSRSARELYRYALEKFFEVNGWSSEDEAVRFLRRGRGRVEKALINFITFGKHMGWAPKSIRLYLSGLRSWLEYNEIKVNWMKVKPFIPKKKAVRNQRALTKSELKMILPYLRPAKRLCVWFMTVTGARLSEALNLKVKDLKLDADPPRAKIKNAKTGGTRIVFIPRDLADELREWVKDRPPNAAVFPSERNPMKPPDKKHIQDAFLNACKKAGIAKRDSSGKGWELSTHSCRRAFKTWLTNVGMNGLMIEILMGHDVGIDRSYYKPSEKELAEEWKKYEKYLLLEGEEPEAEKLRAELEALRKRLRELESRYAEDEALRLLIHESKLLKALAFNPGKRHVIEKELKKVRNQLAELKQVISPEKWKQLEELADVYS